MQICNLLAGIVAFAAVVSSHACAHGGLSSPNSLEVMRDGCQEKDGVFRVTYSDYLYGWRADNAECWYGVNVSDIERLKTLSSQE